MLLWHRLYFELLNKGLILLENQVAKKIVEASVHIHTKLGPGLLESVYETILEAELRKRGLFVARQVPVKVEWDGTVIPLGFRIDLMVEDVVVVEVKSVEQVANVHKKQLLTYLKLTDRKLGLLANFGAPLMRDGLTRVVNGLAEKKS